MFGGGVCVGVIIGGGVCGGVIIGGRDESRPYGYDQMNVVGHYYTVPYFYISVICGDFVDMFFKNFS